MKDRYCWKRKWSDTQRYVPGWDLCHRTNHQSGKPMGLLHPLPIARGHRRGMVINFITDFPVTGSGHDCIVMFVDDMTNRAHWRACRNRIDAPACGPIFIDDIVRQNRVPQEVSSDRTVRFRADCWREVGSSLRTKLIMPTAVLPDTEGLSENSKKTSVHYLGGFASHKQAYWDDYVPLAENAYNFSVHRSTKQTPLQLNLGYEPPLPLDLIADIQRPQGN